MSRKHKGRKENEEEGLIETPGSPERRPPEPDASQTPVLQAIEILRSELSAVKQEICARIDSRIEEVNATLKGEIVRLETDINHKMEAIQSASLAHSKTIQELELAATANSEATDTLNAEMKRISGLISKLSEKCLDLEGRSKRQNLRIAGVREGREHGQNTRDFVAQLLKDVLALDEKPKLDRAHRALRVRSDDNGPPRHLILRVHHCQVLEEILRRAAKDRNLTYQGQRIRIFQDFPPEVVRQRALFTKTREMLRDKPGVRFGLLYPAKLRVTCDGTETVFTDPNEALQFAQRKFGANKG